jgi:CRISPR-associated protein Cas2
MFYVVSYDIPEDRKRDRVSKTLLDFGARVQYSVFECILDGKQFFPKGPLPKSLLIKW